MKEIIISVEEVFNLGEKYNQFDGYKITTDKQEIFVLISNGQSCCEQWGYLSSNDGLEDFSGAELLKLELVDEALNKQQIKDEFKYGLDEGSIIFVNFETDRGTFQLAVYNNHNGYYGHNIKITSNQLTKEMYI